MKTSIVSLFAISFSAASFASTVQQGGQRQQQQMPQDDGTSLEDIQQRCEELSSNDQIKPFSAYIRCSETREFLVPAGKQCFDIPRKGKIKIKALIKSGKHQSDWQVIPDMLSSRRGECPVYRKWQKTAYRKVAVTCDEIQGIESEAAFCSDLLSDVWASCNADQDQAMLGAPFQVQNASQCEWTPTDEVMGCGGTPCGGNEGPTQQEQQQEQCSETSSSSADTSCSSSSSSSCDEGATESGQGKTSQVSQVPAGPWDLGAEIEKVKCDRKVIRFITSHPSVARVKSVPAQGSLLQQIGIQQGDAIYAVNGKRVKGEKSLHTQLKKAKQSQQSFSVETTDTNGQFQIQQKSYK